MNSWSVECLLVGMHYQYLADWEELDLVGVRCRPPLVISPLVWSRARSRRRADLGNLRLD